MTSMVLQGERTTQFRSFRLFVALPPTNHFRNGSMTPAISKIEVKVFSIISAETCKLTS